MAAKAPTDHQPKRNGELVHPGDVIDVDVVGGFEFDWRGGLSPEGHLKGLPAFEGPIDALCRPEDEIAAEIEKVLLKILRAPKVIVRIIDRSGRALTTIDGAVKMPTRYRLMRPVRLRELIVHAGGLMDDASGTIRIQRQSSLNCVRDSDQTAQDNGFKTVNIQIDDILKGKTDPEIMYGDLITVDRAFPVYVIGAVSNPRPLYSRVQMSVSRAIAAAGGLVKNADPTKVVIFRRDGNETRVIDIDLTKTAGERSGDELLKPFDILDVASKGAAKRSVPPVSVDTDTGRRLELPLKVID